MAWSVLQSVSASTTSAVTTVAATFTTANLTAGTKLIAYVASPTTTGLLVSSVKDGAGNLFVQQVHVNFSTNGGLTHDIWVIDTPAGDVGIKPTITATLSGNNAAQTDLLVQEVSGLLAGTSGILDGTAGTLHAGNVAGGLIGPPVYASTASNEFLVYTYADNGTPETMTAPAGYALDANGFNSSSGANLLVCSKNSTGTTETGQWNASATYAAGDSYDMIMVAFLVAAGTATSSPPPLLPIPPGRMSPMAFRFLPRPVSYQVTGGGTSNPLSLTATLLAVQPSEQVSLGKLVSSNPLSAFSSAQNALGKIIASSPVSALASASRSASRTLAALAAVLPAVSVRIGRLVSGQLAALASVSMQKVKLLTLAAQAVASSAVTRQVSRTLSGITAVTGSITRQALRTLAAQAAAFTTVTRQLLRTLPGQAAVTGTSQSRTGRLLSGVAAVTAGTARQAGKGISGVTATAGTITRSITRTLNAVSAALSPVSLTKVKLLALAAQVAATGAEKVSLGKILSGITVAYSSLQNSLGKRISGVTTVTGSTVRGISRLLSGITAASGIITIVKVKLLTLAAQVAAYSAEKISLGKAVQAALAALGTAQGTLRRNMTISAIAVTTGTAARSLGKNISGITAAFSGISSIKVKLLTLAAQVATFAGTTRKISPVISAQIAATGITARSVSRKIAAQAVLTGQAVNSLGKKISGTAVASSSTATQKIRLLVLSALTTVTNAVTRRVGSIQSGTLVTAPSVTRRVTQKIASAMTVNSTVIAGRAFLVKLTAITATSASAVARLSQSAFVIVFKLGTPVFRWITGGLKKVWRIP